MRSRISTKFLTLGIVLLLVALLSIATTMWITRQLDGGAAAVNEAGRLRMQTWRLVSTMQSPELAAERAGFVKEFDQTMILLREGDPRRPLAVPWNNSTTAQFNALSGAWEGLRGQLIDTRQRDPSIAYAKATPFVAQIDGLVNAIEDTMSRLTAMLNLFQFLMMLLAISAAVISLYVGYLFVIHPLQRLREGLQKIGKGDFSERVEADSGDEFGDLAEGFNHMAKTLEGLYQGLEQKVKDKTRDLEAERQRLSALYEVSSFLTEAHSLEQLASGFAQKMRRLSGADAVAIRWSDETSQRYLMLGSDCLPEEIANEERCIEAGLCACGQPQATAHTRIIPIFETTEPRLSTCAKAGYQSLVSVPIRLQNRVLGEVDLFYRHEAMLTQQDKSLYDALSGHLANAIENLRTDALVREAAVSEERTMLARELHDSIAQSLAFLKIQITLLRQAIQRQDQLQIEKVLEELDTGVKESTNDVRELLVHFRTRTNSDDIEDALRTTLRKFEHQSGLSAHLDIQGHGLALPSDTQLQVLHIVQEALSNARKHSQASDVYVTVQRGPGWRFSIRDNGIGFDPSSGSIDETHVGLNIMRERAERIGAQVRVHSQPKQGTEITLDLAQ